MREDSLSEEQRKLIELTLQGKNIFFTGNAGTGRSRVLEAIIQEISKKYGRDAIGVTATTGIAATKIYGQTLHSWAGIGLGKGSRYSLYEQVLANKDARKRWFDCKALIIDEISMLDSEIFETLEFISRKIRNCDVRFGDIQLIVCGDFQQLPPVLNLKHDEAAKSQCKVIPFCFTSPRWKDCFDISVRLTNVFRQSDPILISLLNEIREGGHLSPTAHNVLNMVQREEKDIDHPETVYLYSHKMDVKLKNMNILEKLKGSEFVSKARDTGDKNYLKECPFPATLVYKVGARVMLLTNMHKEGLSNGSLGTVISVAVEKPVVRFDSGQLLSVETKFWCAKNEDGIIVATRRQLPLDLGWALTIHKSQGQSLPQVAVSLHGMFAYGQAYVALSRATTLSGLSVLPRWDHSIPKTPKSVQNFQASIVPVFDHVPLPATNYDNESETPAQTNTENFTATAVPAPRPTWVWEENQSLPSSIDLCDILKVVADRSGRSPSYRTLCNQLEETMSRSESMYRFASYCWKNLENIYVPTGADTKIEFQEAIEKKSLQEKTRRFITFQRNGKLKQGFLLCLMMLAWQLMNKGNLHWIKALSFLTW